MFNKLKSRSTTAAIIYIIAGAFLVIFPTLPIRIICIVLGLIVLIQGIMKIISAVNNNAPRTDLIAGILIAVVGGFLVCSPGFIISIFPIIIGIYIIIEGISQISAAMSLKKTGASKWVISLIIAIVVTAVGILMVINPFGTIELALRVAGITLVIDGISTLLNKA